MMDLTMRVKLLAAPYIIKGIVHGENKCNYEFYLLELLNCSTWFSAQYPGEFYRPKSESHGECDAVNQDYQIDFKLLAAETALQARSIFSSQVYKEENGSVAFCECRRPDGEIKATRLFAALRGKSLVDLYNIRENKTEAHGVEHDVFEALKTLETKKNLLLFFPYKFTFDRPHDYNEAVKSIGEALTGDFHIAFEYRNCQTQGQFDTFLTCIYDQIFLIFLWKNQRLQLVDIVKAEDLPTFVQLSEYTEWGWIE